MYDAIVVGARVAGAPTAMLLARAGHRVLLVDRDTFPSDIMSTHYIHPPGMASLQRWGLLERVRASGCPSISRFIMRMGPATLEGFGPAVDGISDALCVRRVALDKILVDAAVEAGAELREGFTVQELIFEDDRVMGICGRDRDGATVSETARIVVGADGQHSLVARVVAAPRYNEKPPLACYYYTYWSGVSLPHAEIGMGEGSIYGAFPTNDDRLCLIVGLKHERFHHYRADIEGTYMGVVAAIAPDLAAKLGAGRREERWVGTADLPNFFRKPYGPGWALVGDAGYHKDPATGYGITDAFRDAETLAQALDAGFSGREPLAAALAAYEQTRNAFAMPMYEFICQMAALDPPPPELEALIGALAVDQAALTQFCGVLDGSVSVPEFFAPENIERIMAAAAVRALPV